MVKYAKSRLNEQMMGQVVSQSGLADMDEAACWDVIGAEQIGRLLDQLKVSVYSFVKCAHGRGPYADT